MFLEYVIIYRNNDYFIPQNGQIRRQISLENIFVVKNGKISTPPLDADVLNGITRDSAIKLLKSNKIKVIEKNIKISDLLKADEIFMTGTAAELKSVTRVDKTKIGN